ncbi:LacI family DNA-binding transcriptional regulator [Streptomyces sp. NPDC046900]|uniref:LacI family DNA-binding transcriptional regulator n=1 Tax=Streptomyces sp. NPDC046900 TaxID=3155473 RepID=UPI0033DB3BED
MTLQVQAKHAEADRGDSRCWMVPLIDCWLWRLAHAMRCGCAGDVFRWPRRYRPPHEEPVMDVQQPDTPPRPPTITLLAKQLNVSPATVSRAFSRPELLRPDTVQRVLDAAAAAGYVPNRHARALSTGHTAAIGLVVADIANPFFAPLIRGVETIAQDRGFTVLLGNTDENPDREERVINTLVHQVEGLLVCSPRQPSASLRRLAQQHRVVLVNRDIHHTDRVLLDTGPAVRQAVEVLRDYGHRRLAYLAGPPSSWSNSQRRRAALAKASELQLHLEVVEVQAGTYAAARSVADQLLDAEITAVLAFDDVMAHGVMGGLAARGVRVPDDVSVIGCDDVLATTTYPPLSTIAVDMDAAAQAASRLLLDRGDAPPEPIRTVLPATLVLRGTVAAAP